MSSHPSDVFRTVESRVQSVGRLGICAGRLSHQAVVDPESGSTLRTTGAIRRQAGKELKLRCQQGRCQPTTEWKSRRLHRSLQFSGRSPARRNPCEQYICKLWRGAKHVRSPNRFCLADVANDNPAGAARRVRHVLLALNRPVRCVNPCSLRHLPLTRIITGLANAAATFQAPFAQPFPAPNSFPMFVPYSPTTSSSVNAQAPNFRPAMVQQFSLNVQGEFAKDWLLEVGYVGSRGTHLQRLRSLNQALSASPKSDRGSLRTRWPTLDRGCPFLAYAPTLFAKWNRREATGTTGWKLA